MLVSRQRLSIQVSSHLPAGFLQGQSAEMPSRYVLPQRASECQSWEAAGWRTMGLKLPRCVPGPLFLGINGSGVYSVRDPSRFLKRFASAPKILGLGKHYQELSLKLNPGFSLRGAKDVPLVGTSLLGRH